ncbi:hypothetical protein GE09DRAFT_1109970 [Coniochaeta sp. 2T2.1]|nr:hypothetical protein GE09DRAFT_1109970 [Coniochaeta sp. 2T2.1]
MEMQSDDDPLVSPYSTASFPGGSFSVTSADSPAFHRYQHGDLVSQFYTGQEPDMEFQQHHGQLDNSPNPQNFAYQVLGTPYMMAQPVMYGQQITQGSAAMSTQQMQNHFAPNMVEPSTPGSSASNQGVSLAQFRHSPAATYAPQHPTSAPISMSYSSPVTISQPTEYAPTARRDSHRGSISTLYRNNSTASLDSMSSNSYQPPPAPQTVPKLFTFVTPQVGGTPSETSSFNSDGGAGSQQRSQKGAKKRGSIASRRPRKPPLEVMTESKLQNAPQIQRHEPRNASPKRARTSISHAELKTTVETMPDSSLTVSPGTISKAHIGQRSRASTNASQQSMSTSQLVQEMVQQSREPQQDHSDDVRYLSQRLHEFIEANTKRVDELDKKVQHLEHEKDELDRNVQYLKHENVMLSRQHTEMKKTVVDIKCKVLEEFSVGDAMRDRSPRADAASTGPQMTAHIDLRRPSNASILTTSTTMSSTRNSPAETVYSNQDATWWYKPPKGLEQNGAENVLVHSGVYQSQQ